ncbi:MAG: hypothetical protein AAF267_24815 [Deinococcota bacterium]
MSLKLLEDLITTTALDAFFEADPSLRNLPRISAFALQTIQTMVLDRNLSAATRRISLLQATTMPEAVITRHLAQECQKLATMMHEVYGAYLEQSNTWGDEVMTLADAYVQIAMPTADVDELSQPLTELYNLISEIQEKLKASL